MIPLSPESRAVMSADGLQIATYDFGAEAGLGDDAPVVLAVHGFASSAIANWQATGWVRELTRAGCRVIALDQRGHGASAKPHDPAAYSMEALVSDVAIVIDTYLIDELAFVGYSLGARVGWHSALEVHHHVTRLVLGGIPDGDPLTRFRVDEAKAFLDGGPSVADPLTAAYLKMAGSLPGNDLTALVALVEGMRGGAQPDPADPPQQPVLFATGSEDRILEKSRALAAATPRASSTRSPAATTSTRRFRASSETGRWRSSPRPRTSSSGEAAYRDLPVDRGVAVAMTRPLPTTRPSRCRPTPASGHIF